MASVLLRRVTPLGVRATSCLTNKSTHVVGNLSIVLLGVRRFGIHARVTQRRRARGRIIQLKQTHYEPKPEGYTPLPLSLLGTGNIRRVLNTNTVEAKQLAGTIEWDRYRCDVRGVRWHPVGGWRVQFDRRDYEHNFFVKCDCYFRVGIYSFEHAKELAVAYRRRLEYEWDEQQHIWNKMDAEREAKRQRKRVERKLALEAEEFAEDGDAGMLDFLPVPERREKK